MNIFFYNIFIRLYKCGICIVSLFNKKAKLWLEGRKGIFPELQQSITGDAPVIWIHCASLGEFEQGRPVLESLKASYPDYKILLTFFSPSGYEIRKNFALANWVYYLPLDTKSNAKQFIELVNPRLVIFVKYEYWFHYLNELHRKQIPTLLISAIFRKDAIFFKWYGNLHVKMLGFFNHIFVQTSESGERIKTIVSPEKITLAGDTRFDRVADIAKAFEPIPIIEKFSEGRKLIVAGSTWPKDEEMLEKVIFTNSEISLIIAPHEITKDHIQFLKRKFNKAVLYSELIENNFQQPSKIATNILIIDNIGMLSKLYNYSTISYIGGGFNKSGIHNTLEAAVYGKPVIFGPNYQKFAEAINLIKINGGNSYSSENELINIINKLIKNPKLLEECSNNAATFVAENTGATKTITNWIEQNVF